MATTKKRSTTLAHVHETSLSLANLEMSPPHPPRVETPEYEKAHHFLVYTKNSPCVVCGVTQRTLKNPKRNPFQAKQLESHHSPCEWSLLHALDWRKVHKRYPSVYSQESLERWIDSPENLVILCDVHHRSLEYGIHHLAVSDWSVLPFLRDGYIIASSRKNVQAAQATDEKIMQDAGMEPTKIVVAVQPVAS